ncbi:PIR Superfamily Protein [Plasmodium ovale wallikeri]|uniref:PIR Superfamily Protein n=1 Tax=Plasmodium ovale wallikeri TaxID=864142 RepID=A0A1A9AGF7_PLAOA|nr:PIR Superfamily Protein [Plasmodium ovale wallikeri]
MGREGEDNLGVFTKSDDEEEEDEDEELEVDDDALGEAYYSSVSSFHIYEEEFSAIHVQGSNTDKYKNLCKTFSDVFFNNNYPMEHCYEIAKYLQHIKDKGEDDTEYRCKCLNYILNTDKKFNKLTGYEPSKLFKSYKKLSSKFDKCYLIIEHIKNVDVLEKIRKLYDLNKAKNKLENSISSNKDNISESAQKFVEYYRNSINDCSTYYNDDYCVELKGFEQYINQCMKSDKHTEAWEILKTLVPNDGTSIIVPFIMILGIPFFLYILYKFTPLGSWANTQIRKKIKMWNNLPENESELHIPLHDQLNMENNKFNIKYHSA